VLTSGDLPSMSLRYLQAADGLRPDVAVLCWELLSPTLVQLQGHSWRELGVHLPLPPRNRNAHAFALANDPDVPGARPLLLLDVFRQLGPRNTAQWPMGEFVLFPRGPFMEVRRATQAQQLFVLWKQGAPAMLTPLPHAAEQAAQMGHTWHIGSWEMPVLWMWWVEREQLVIHAMNFAADHGLPHGALEVAAKWGLRFLREGEARAIALSPLFWRNLGLVLHLLGQRRAALDAWACYFKALRLPLNKGSGEGLSPVERHALHAVAEIACPELMRVPWQRSQRRHLPTIRNICASTKGES